MTSRTFKLALLALAASGLLSCGEDAKPGLPSPLLLAPEGNRLHAYLLGDEVVGKVLVPSHSDDPRAGRDINGQICFQPGTGRFISGEDTGQPTPPPGWGFFELEGTDFGSLSAKQIGRLTPTFQGEPGEEGVPDTADPYGCGFLSDGRLVTTDIGNNQSGPGTGQIILWFPPFDTTDVAYCKLDIAIPTAGSVYIDAGDRIYVASARAEPGIHRLTGRLPTSADAAGGCGRTDSTGAPLADDVRRELFIASDLNLVSPNGVVGTARGTFYVSSIINGVIAEYDQTGGFLRRVLEPPAGELIGEEPYSTGTPLGIAIDPDGTLFYADLGLTVTARGIGPSSGKGSVRRIRFDAAAEPLPPETIESGLTFPDGLGVLSR